MYKKVLCLVAIASYSIVHSSDNEARTQLKQQIKELCDAHFGENDAILAAYDTRLIKDYEQALITAVSGSGNAKAIENKFNANKTENTSKEQEKNNLLDDGTLGWFDLPTPASENSVKGLLQMQWKILKEEQDKKNAAAKEAYVVQEKNFNEHVKSVMMAKLTDRRYTLLSRYQSGLNECGDNVACLKVRDISWKNIQDPKFLDRQDAQMYDVIYAIVKEKEIRLTRDQIVAIAATIRPTANSQEEELRGKTLVEQMAVGKRRIQEKVHSILNPGQTVTPSILHEDPKEDQGDQGALSE